MVCHGKTIWHQVIAIKSRRNIQLADFFSVLKCLIHTYSAVISIFLVLIMNFPHGVSKWLILPWFALTFKIIVKRLSADLQRVAVKTNFSGVPAVTLSISKSKYGSTSTLLMMSASQTVKISGYFSGRGGH